ncbi:hypothetical protein PoB_004125600 [Plakobranchus ocellatus]|uniref:Uncharacterized protein n=1 Tax=Plakobranchus ocellatus TaxID=259542 RepID=A0AAV4B2K1_9GAST|nr:hypothetical protein PoB_004125600 [Plakobranchus ocellatus]
MEKRGGGEGGRIRWAKEEDEEERRTKRRRKGKKEETQKEGGEGGGADRSITKASMVLWFRNMQRGKMLTLLHIIDRSVAAQLTLDAEPFNG